MEQQQPIKGLPEHAFEPLPPGQEYIPYIPADKIIPEVTFRSLLWGILMSLLFSAAAAFSGLKVGQVFEAAIPIAIIAVGISPIYRRKNTILENVIIQSIGAASGVVVAGAIFTLPAIFILGLDKKIGIDLIKIFVVSFLGGSLGILFLIPFRKYFVKEMHAQFPFPEATATTQILVTGEQGGKQAKILIRSMIIGSIYDFMVHTVEAFNEVFTSGMKIFKWGHNLHVKERLVLKFDTLSMIMGLGFIIGLRYSAIIVAGSLLSWVVLIPAIFHLRDIIPAAIIGPANLIAPMSAEDIYFWKVRFIGIGAIAIAGIISIIKSYKVIYQAVGTGFQQIFKKTSGQKNETILRTQHDMKMKNVFILIVFFAMVMLLFFNFFILNQLQGTLKLSLLSMLTVLIFSFLFTTVAARATAITGNNPVSGMTLMTVILSSGVLAAAGLRGDYGMLAALMIGGVVCAALSMSGGFVTDLKTGYWLGSTPLKQEKYKFIGTFVAAISVGVVIFLLNRTYGFDPSAAKPLAAPQANAMATVIQSLMNPQAQMPWLLLLSGGIIALIINFLKLPTLAFALGMYLPLQLNTPLLVGGFISYLLLRSTPDKELAAKRNDKGILIASGFIAGGALIGVVSAALKLTEKYVIVFMLAAIGLIFALRPIFKKVNKWMYYIAGLILVAVSSTLLWNFHFEKYMILKWAERMRGEPLSMLMFICLCFYLYFDAKAAKKEA